MCKPRMFSRTGWLLAALWACHGPLHAADYQVLERGPHSKTWQRQELDDTGQLVTHQYVQYETGMHFLEQGQWLESVPHFEVFKGQGFVARRGPIQAILSATLAPDGLEVLTEAGRFRGGCLGLSFYDPATGQSVVLAHLKAVPGELIAPNQVLYPDCFEGEAVCGSIRITLEKASLEQDIIIHANSSRSSLCSNNCAPARRPRKPGRRRSPSLGGRGCVRAASCLEVSLPRWTNPSRPPD